MRYFEKISFEQFKKDVSDDINIYDSYNIPSRSTKTSAGYDFVALNDFDILPGEIKKIPSGIKTKMNDDEYLGLYIRSSLGFKYNIRLTNQVGIIDSDYYNNENNEGHIWYSIQNEGEKPVSFKKNDRLVQGIFSKFLIVSDEQEIKNTRFSGIGSTNKESENNE